MAKMMDKKGGMCPCPHHRIVPMMGGLLIVLGGLVKLMEAMGKLDSGKASLWIAVFVILFGIGLLGKGFCKCCSTHK